jgi:tetratricopeptide (TPR) repeat protein
MTARRLLPALLLASVIAHAQTQDIYQRVRQTVGEGGEAELRARNFSAVEQRLAHFTPANDSARAEVLALRGAVAFLAGKLPQAAADFREADKILPVREGDRFTLAMALVRLGDGVGARAELTRLTNEHETSAIYWYWLGRLDYDQRRYTEAVGNLEKAVKLDPKASRAWDSLGLAWDMQGQMERARDIFEKAVALNREQKNPSPWPPHDLGYLLLRMGEPAKAEQALRESLRYNPNLAQTHYYLARSLEKEDRAPEAIEEYQIATAADPTSADSCYSLAMLYRKLGREADAKEMLAEFRRRKGTAEPAPISH